MQRGEVTIGKPTLLAGLVSCCTPNVFASGEFVSMVLFIGAERLKNKLIQKFVSMVLFIGAERLKNKLIQKFVSMVLFIGAERLKNKLIQKRRHNE